MRVQRLARGNARGSGLAGVRGNLAGDPVRANLLREYDKANRSVNLSEIPEICQFSALRSKLLGWEPAGAGERQAAPSVVRWPCTTACGFPASACPPSASLPPARCVRHETT